MSKGTSINLVQGIVEVTTKARPLTRVRERFDKAIVVGDTPEDIRRNFRYSECFLSRQHAARRASVKQLEAEGRVRLVEITVTKVIGRTNY